MYISEDYIFRIIFRISRWIYRVIQWQNKIYESDQFSITKYGCNIGVQQVLDESRLSCLHLLIFFNHLVIFCNVCDDQSGSGPVDPRASVQFRLKFTGLLGTLICFSVGVPIMCHAYNEPHALNSIRSAFVVIRLSSVWRPRCSL